MSAPGYAQKLAAYQSVATHGGVAASDPHRLIVMLMDGALERIASARALARQGDHTEKARLLHRTVSIIDELRIGGETKSINVQPKGGMPAYQVGPVSGERSWKVLGF